MNKPIGNTNTCCQTRPLIPPSFVDYMGAPVLLQYPVPSMNKNKEHEYKIIIQYNLNLLYLKKYPKNWDFKYVIN